MGPTKPGTTQQSWQHRHLLACWLPPLCPPWRVKRSEGRAIRVCLPNRLQPNLGAMDDITSVMQPTTAHGWGSHVTVVRARCATAPLFCFTPASGQWQSSWDHSQMPQGEQESYGSGAPLKAGPESPESAVYPCGTGESIVGLGTCLRGR